MGWRESDSYCVFSFFVTFLLWAKLEIYKVLEVQEKGLGVEGEAPSREIYLSKRP